jgi:hypothetical protein
MAKSKKSKKEKMVRVVWGSNENTPVLYANHIQVTHAGRTDFHVTFGHLSPPLKMGAEESELQDKLTVKPLVTIVTSPDAMRSFVAVLNGSLADFENGKNESKKE